MVCQVGKCIINLHIRQFKTCSKTGLIDPNLFLVCAVLIIQRFLEIVDTCTYEKTCLKESSNPTLGSMLTTLEPITVFLLPSNVKSKFASASKSIFLFNLKLYAPPAINFGAVNSVDFTGMSFFVT